MIPDLPQQPILLLWVCGGCILIIVLVDEGTLKEMDRSLAVVDDAHHVTVFKAQRSVCPRQTMELLLQELLTPPDKLPLLDLDVHADLPPVVGNYFAHLHELRQFRAGRENIGRFETLGITSFC